MSRPSILLIEDNPDDEVLTLRALEKSTLLVDVEIVRDGAKALDHILEGFSAGPGKQARLPSLILLDLKLPKVSGLDILQQIRQHPVTALLPVVVLTTSDEHRDLIDIYRLGANSYVRKPVDFQKFSAAIARLSEYWLTINEPPPLPEPQNYE